MCIFLEGFSTTKTGVYLKPRIMQNKQSLQTLPEKKLRFYTHFNNFIINPVQNILLLCEYGSLVFVFFWNVTRNMNSLLNTSDHLAIFKGMICYSPRLTTIYNSNHFECKLFYGFTWNKSKFSVYYNPIRNMTR